MSENEYVTAMIAMRDSVGFHGMNYVGILFAYLIAGYFAAEQLSRFQAITATVFYLVLCPMPAFAAYDACIDLTVLFYEYQQAFKPDKPTPLFIQYWPNAWLVLVPSTMALSVVFMVQARMSRMRPDNTAEHSATAT